jgi:hypothetical protein
MNAVLYGPQQAKKFLSFSIFGERTVSKDSFSNILQHSEIDKGEIAHKKNL